MGGVDLLIVTALPEEFAAAKAVGSNEGPGGRGVAGWENRTAGGVAPYLWGVYGMGGERRLSVALTRPVRMGGRGTAPIVTTLTDALRPRCVAMCGVCAGNPDETALGDVVVGEPVYEWDEGKLSERAFTGDHRQYPLPTGWVRAAQDFDPTLLPSYGPADDEEALLWLLERLHLGQELRNHPARDRYFPPGTWAARLDHFEVDGLIARDEAGLPTLTEAGSRRAQRRLYDDVDGPRRLPFAVRVGPMASGSAVVGDPAIWPWLKATGVRRIAALEMEAATLATIAHERQVPFLVAKGVTDYANAYKDDRYRAFAARASAEVLYALLERVLPEVSAGTCEHGGHALDVLADGAAHSLSCERVIRDGIAAVRRGNYEQGVELLVRHATTASDDATVVAELRYYAALALLGGASPRVRTWARIRQAEQHLSAAVHADPDSPHAYALWAVIKEDYHQTNGISPIAPALADLRSRAASISAYRAAEIVRHVPASTSPTWLLLHSTSLRSEAK